MRRRTRHEGATADDSCAASAVTEVVDSEQADRFEEMLERRMLEDDELRRQWTHKGPRR